MISSARPLQIFSGMNNCKSQLDKKTNRTNRTQPPHQKQNTAMKKIA